MDTAIETHGLTKRFGRQRALNGIDLSIPPGQVFGYLGPNGAGKTTTIRLLAGLLHPTAGTASVLGLDVVRERDLMQRRLGYLPGSFVGYPDLSGEQFDHDVVARAGLSEAAVWEVEQREGDVLDAWVASLRRGRPKVPLEGRVAVVVDDGIATGSTVRAACEVVRRLGAARVVVASPVAPHGTTADDLAADELVCCEMPWGFRAVGNYYRDFSPTTDEEVCALLDDVGREAEVFPSPASGRPVDTDVDIALVGGVVLRGRLDLPAGAAGVVVFAHGSGSSRHSPRDQYVAHQLQLAGLGTLLVDLLAPDEVNERRNVFDIPLLGTRLGEVGRWLLAQPETGSCKLGYFGASTGAGAALWAAAEPDSRAEAVVSRGGRPDLTGDRLPWVKAPTLLIVGSADPSVLDLNQRAQARMRCPSRLVVVPGASQLFEEPGALEEAARLASTWFAGLLLGAGTAISEGRGVP